jgi:hypothetical protein
VPDVPGATTLTSVSEDNTLSELYAVSNNDTPETVTVTPHLATLAVSEPVPDVVYLAKVPLIAHVVIRQSISITDASLKILFFFIIFSPFQFCVFYFQLIFCIFSPC